MSYLIYRIITTNPFQLTETLPKNAGCKQKKNCRMQKMPDAKNAGCKKQGMFNKACSTRLLAQLQNDGNDGIELVPEADDDG